MKTPAIQKHLLWIALAILAVLAIYRIGFHIPVPGFDAEVVKQAMGQ
jgi:preprotein translocase subunit SecY